MTLSKLDCHRASLDERRAAFTNVYEFWGNDLPLDKYVQWRLKSLHHLRATWYVGVLEGQVAASLGVFPMSLSLDGTLEKTMFVGAVHTHPDFRRRGFAAELLYFAEQDQAQEDVRWSFLFSDIDPQYYARLGYVVNDAPNVCIKPGATAGFEVELFNPADAVEKMQHFYDVNQQDRTCSLFRTLDYWNFLAQKHRQDTYLWLIEQGECCGYLHLRCKDDLACLEDFAVVSHTPEQLRRVAGSVSLYAESQGIGEVHGWFPPVSTEQPWLEINDRQMEITMWKSLTEKQLTTEQQRELAYFRHVDHV